MFLSIFTNLPSRVVDYSPRSETKVLKIIIKLIIENLLLVEIFSFSVLIVRYFKARRRGEIVRTVRTKSKPINFLDEMDIKQSSGLLLHIINFRRKTIRVLYLFDKLCHVSDHSGQSSVH